MFVRLVSDPTQLPMAIFGYIFQNEVERSQTSQHGRYRWSFVDASLIWRASCSAVGTLRWGWGGMGAPSHIFAWIKGNPCSSKDFRLPIHLPPNFQSFQCCSINSAPCFKYLSMWKKSFLTLITCLQDGLFTPICMFPRMK